MKMENHTRGIKVMQARPLRFCLLRDFSRQGSVKMKTKIKKFLQWTSSRYNSMTKKEVIDNILLGFAEGRQGKALYSCGSYTPSSSMGGRDYEVDFDKKTIKRGLANDYDIMVKVFEEMQL